MSSNSTFKKSMFLQIPILILLVFGVINSVHSDSDNIYQAVIEAPFDSTYDKVYKALESQRFYVVYELNIGKSLARNKERWGEEYNRNEFEEVRTMIVCNPWYANQVLNKDPRMIALCPLTISVLYKKGIVTIYFERLTVKTEDGPLSELLWEIESTIISAIEGAIY
jgi:uncharacterized protein (DUF302 family)